LAKKFPADIKKEDSPKTAQKKNYRIKLVDFEIEI
jgi:hypothetical protein